MNNPKFSITIPAFKGRYLAEAIESCLKQIYSNFEVIIVDDASPEDLEAVVKPYMKDLRVRFYRNEKNCGAVNVVDNWNICLGYCSGDYVICMGDDDRLLPCCLVEYAKLIEKYPGIGLVHGWTELINEQGTYHSITSPRPEYENAYSVLLERWRGRSQYIGDWCYEINWLRSNGGYYKIPLAWASDDISAIIGASKNGVANTQVLCFQYRVSSQTISNTGNLDIKVAAIAQERDWYKEFLAKEPEEELCRKIWHSVKMIDGKQWDKKFVLTYYTQIRKNPLKLIDFIKLKNKYRFGTKTVLFAIYMAIKGK